MSNEWEDGDKLAADSAQDQAEAASTETVNAAPATVSATTETESPEVAETEESPAEDSLPDDLKESFALLNKIDGLPESTSKLEREKAARRSRVCKHIARLQAGLPIIHLGADELAKSQKNHSKILKRQRIELLARENLDVRELLEAYDDLVERFNALNSKKK